MPLIQSGVTDYSEAFFTRDTFISVMMMEATIGWSLPEGSVESYFPMSSHLQKMVVIILQPQHPPVCPGACSMLKELLAVAWIGSRPSYSLTSCPSFGSAVLL